MINLLLSSTIYAQISAYTCEGQKVCINAAGNRPVAGVSAACPRFFALGTRIRIADRTLTCDDRTARWIEKKYPNTFDVYVNTEAEAWKIGRQRVEVLIPEQSL